MLRIISFALMIFCTTACNNIAATKSTGEFPAAGEYRREAIGCTASTVSASRYEQLGDAAKFADRMLGPKASSYQQKDVSTTNGKIAISAICPLMGMESKITITGGYGKDFWNYQRTISLRLGSQAIVTPIIEV